MYQSVGDLEVHYDVAGQGAPIVLIHGAGADLWTWDEVSSPLSARFTVWRYDQRGFGQTTRPSAPKMSLDAWTEDLSRFLDAMHLDQVALVGWSMGGAVAINFAGQFPSRVTHLVTLGCPGPTRVVQDKSGFEARQQLANQGASVEEIIDATFEFTKAAFSQKSRNDNLQGVEKMRQALLRNNPADYGEMVDALDGLSAFAPRLSKIDCPTLIACGEEDARTPVEMSRELHASINGSELAIIPNCGHYYAFESPSEVTRLIQRFIEKER